MGDDLSGSRDVVGLAQPGDRDVADTEAVRELLGREPRGAFRVVVRAEDGTPMVIRNRPLLDDGTPMPTLYWLLDRDLNRRIGRLEAGGGVKQSEHDVGVAELADAHARYAAERDALIPADWTGPRPFGGVGGTRNGVKCLHTHYAWFLAGGDDPIGRWVDDHLTEPADPARPVESPDPARPAASPDPARAGDPTTDPTGADL